jgi:hypothetical protein
MELKYKFEEEEKLVFLSIGSSGTPIKSKIHFQKVIFLISNIIPNYKEAFDYEPYNFGPYSETAESVLEDLKIMGMITQNKSAYSLSEKGMLYYNNYANEANEQLLNTVDEIKKLTEKLNDKELLTYIYLKYPEYQENSIIWDKLKPQLHKYIKSLIKKQILNEDDEIKYLKLYLVNE